MRPITVRAAHGGDITGLQREGLDRVVDYLANSLESKPDTALFPPTGRIVIEWGDEEELAQIKEGMA